MGGIATDINVHLRQWVSERMQEGVGLDEAIQEYAVSFPDRGEQQIFETALASFVGNTPTHYDVVMTKTEALKALETHLIHKKDRSVAALKNSQNFVQEVATARARLKATKEALANCLNDPAIARSLEVITHDISSATSKAKRFIDEASDKREKINQMENDIQAIKAQRLALRDERFSD